VCQSHIVGWHTWSGIEIVNLSIVLSTQQTQFQAASMSGSLEANMARISALGYQGVELAIRDPKLVDLDSLIKLTRKFGLQVPAIGTGQAWGEEGMSFTDPDPKIRRAAIERIKSHVTVASKLNAVIIIGLIRGIVKPGVDQEQAMKWLCEAIQECSLAAKTSNVKLALEPINHYETTLINNVDQGLDLIALVGADNFGLLLDTFHMNIEESNIEKSIRKCGERVFHFHVADSNRWYPGAGHLDFKSILDTLSGINYQGFISGEFLPKPDPETAAKKNIEYIHQLVGIR
jgi:sugar phosphate isomerase/epimerase